MQRRRTVIKSVGALASTTAVGTVSAKNQTATQTWTEGFRRRLRNSFNRDGVEGVERLMQEQKLEYDLSSSATRNDPSSQSDAGAENRYSETDSELVVLLHSVSGEDNQVRLTVLQRLNTEVRFRSRDVTYIDDVIAVGFDRDHWSVVGDPTIGSSTDGVHEADWYPSSAGRDGLSGVVDLNYRTTSSGYQWLPDEIISMEVVLENRDGLLGTLWGSYEHTRAYTPTSGYIQGITVQVGPAVVDLSTDGFTAWDMADSVDPSAVM